MPFSVHSRVKANGSGGEVEIRGGDGGDGLLVRSEKHGPAESMMTKCSSLAGLAGLYSDLRASRHYAPSVRASEECERLPANRCRLQDDKPTTRRCQYASIQASR
jgi:hypothetical protein